MNHQDALTRMLKVVLWASFGCLALALTLAIYVRYQKAQEQDRIFMEIRAQEIARWNQAIEELRKTQADLQRQANGVHHINTEAPYMATKTEWRK